MKLQYLLGIGVISFFGIVSNVYGQAHPQVNVGLISGPFGTGSYVISTALEEVCKKYHPWLRVSHSESPGFVFNRKKLEKEPEFKKTMVIGHGPVVN